MTTAERIGKVIVELRKQKGVSQERMSLEAPIARRYMSNLENGKSNPSLDVLERAAHYLGLKLSELIVLAENYNE